MLKGARLVEPSSPMPAAGQAADPRSASAPAPDPTFAPVTLAVSSAVESTQRVIVFLRGLLVASCTLPLCVLAALAWHDYVHIRAAAEERVRRTVETIHQHTLKVLETEELILDRVLAAADGMAADEISRSAAITTLMRRMSAGKEQIASIWLVDAVGQIVASSRTMLGHFHVPERDYFVAQRDEDVGTFVGAPHIGKTSGRTVFNLSRRRTSAAGAFDGVTAVAVSVAYLQDFFRSVGAGPGEVARLVRADGELLVQSPAPSDAARPDPVDRLPVPFGAADRGVMWLVSAADKVERLTAFQRIDPYRLYVTLEVDRATALQPWYASLTFDAEILVPSAVVLTLVTLLALVRARREQIALMRLAAEMRQRATIEAQFRQAQKMGALGELTSGLAHDFKNLLTAIRIYVDVIQGSLTDRKIRKLADAVIREVHRADNLIRSLIAFARRQPMEVRTFDLNAAILGMRPLLRQSVGGGIAIEFALGRDVRPVKADINQTEVAILNLAINARDAMPAGGTLRISTANVELAGEPDCLVGPYVAIAMADTGGGMSPDVLARAFEPFFTTKAPDKGSGLGLSSVYGFARQSQGAAVITSSPGEGTSVVIYLPTGC
jgi:signal transduction histidine kinase